MKKTTLMISLIGVSVAAVSQAETAHQHGVADLNIAMSNNDLLIEWHTPADNILGFEFMPKTDQQKQTLSDSLSLLKQPSSLFEIPKQAQCDLKQTQVHNPFESKKMAENDHKEHEHKEHEHKEHEHKEHEHKEHGHDEDETHAEFDVQYSYHCQQPDYLTGLKINGVFKHFPRVETLNVAWLNDSQQSAATVTKETMAVSFNP